MENYFEKVNIKHIDTFLSVCSLTALIGVTFCGVIWRYIFSQPIIWEEDFQLWMIVWVVCFGSSVAFRMGNHIAIDMVVTKLPRKIQSIVIVLVYIIVFCLLGFLFYNGINYILQLATSNRVTSILKIPYALIYSSFPIGIIMMLVQYSVDIWKEIFKKDNANKEEIK